MKKKYVFAEIEVIKLNFGDVITASSGSSDDPDNIPNDPLQGGYDPGGWT